MTSMLIDAGPLVALLNRRDRYHSWIRDLLDTVEPPLFTCEPVLSEACFVLRRETGGQDAVLALVGTGVVRTEFRVESETDALRSLMLKFDDVPMSLADACLVRMSELDAHCRVVTLDGDFAIYRRNRRQAIPTIMPPPGS